MAANLNANLSARWQPAWLLRAGGVPIGVLIGMAAAPAVARSPIASAAFVAAAIIGAVFVMSPQSTLPVIVAGAFTFSFLASLGLLPGSSSWIVELAIAALGVRVLLLSRQRALYGSTFTLDACVAAALLAGMLGFLVNTTSLVTLLLGLRSWFKWVLLFYLILNLDIPVPTLHRALRAAWIFVFIQPFLVAAQWMTSDCRNCYVDAYYGTLMSTATLAILAGFATAIVMAFLVERRDRRGLLLLIPMLFALGLADSKGGLFLAATGGASVLAYRALRTRLGAGFRTMILPLGMLAVSLYVATDFASRNLDVNIFELVFNPRVLSDYSVYDPNIGLRISRADDIEIGFRLARELPTGGLVGAGPGSGSVSAFTEYAGDIQKRGATATGRTVLWVQAGRLIVEFGMAGAAAWAGIFAGLFLIAHRTYPIAAVRPYASAMIGFVFVIIAAHFYQTILDPPLVVLWLTAAFLLRVERLSPDWRPRA